MHATMTVKHGRRDAELDRLFDRERERIERRLSHDSADAAVLHGVLDRNPHCQEAYASLTLRLGARTLNAHGVGPALAPALRDAADELLVEFDRWRRHVRANERANASRRVTESFESAELFDEWIGSPAADRGIDLDASVRRVLPELRRFVAKELARHVAVLDRPEFAQIEAADVVEEALVAALVSIESKPDDVPFDRWLFGFAYDALVREEERARPRESLEAKARAARSADGDTSGEEIVLAMTGAREDSDDDSPPGSSRGADEEAWGRDVRLAALRAIRELPDRSRRALSLIALEGLGESDAARRLHWTESEMHAALDHAREAVRVRLLGQGVLTR